MPKNDDLFIANREEELRDKLELQQTSTIPDRISADAESVENGLAKLVLSIIELVRQLLEKQALRRMDGGNLSEDEIEELGLALMRLEEKMDELKKAFNLSNEDLKLSLGSIKTIE